MAMVSAVLISNIPASILAAMTTKDMAHLKAGSTNGNAHFGGDKPEAFVLSDKADIKSEDFSFKMKLGSEKAQTRFRFVTKYVNDASWGVISYDGASGWYYQYKNEGKEGWPGFNVKLPEINLNDFVEISGSYKTDGLHVTVNNKTQGTTGEAIAATKEFTNLKDLDGKIGFGAGTYQSEYTDIYFSDVKVGEKIYQDGDYAKWSLYKGANQTWEPSVKVEVNDGTTAPDEPTNGRKWIKVTGGTKNGSGHEYGNPDKNAPIALLNNDRKMGDAGALSMSLKPSANWGVFYNYLDDNNWLYVGWDSSSKWYYQYKLDGKEEYPKITGLPDPVAGEEMKLTISLSRETLSINVNGTSVNVTNQNLIKFAEKTSGKGRFGVKTNGQTSISFADATLNGVNCMEDSWVFAAERLGQKKEVEFTKLYPFTGMITDEVSKEPVAGASVRVGNKSARTTAEGTFGFEGLEKGNYAMAVTMPGYQAYSGEIEIKEGENNLNVSLSKKKDIELDTYDKLTTDNMSVYIGKQFPKVARYVMSDGSVFRANETALDTVKINGVVIKPMVTIAETTATSRTYTLSVKDAQSKLDFVMDVTISVKDNTLTWQVTKLEKADGCPKIATIDVPGLNLLTVDAMEKNANFAGAQTSTTTTSSGDNFIDFNNGFVPSNSEGYLYGFLTNEKLSAGLFSNSEIEEDKRVVRNNGADTISLTSAPWYYELGDMGGQAAASRLPEYPTSELPCTKVAIANDLNEDRTIDWNDGALAFRDIMNIPYGSENIKDMVNNRIVMNFASMASNPYLVTADNIKKVGLATDGLPQAVMLKGYGNEGHDSANSEYADIAEREGGVKDFQELIKIAHENNTEIGVHVNAQEIYPEAASFNENMIQKPIGNGWGWLDQSHIIDKHWDLATQARWKRFVQLYDRINNTNHYSRTWPDAVEDSKGEVKADKSEIKKEAESLPDNMDFIYLDVWYQGSWETRQIAKEINSLGWRFSTEFSSQGEYDSTWQHWSTDAAYGGATAKGFNSDIIRFIRNDQRDSQVLNFPSYGGTADNPLLGGYRLYGFEGWGGDKDFNKYIEETFNQNLPTKFLQHYYVIDWENYAEGESPVGNHEKSITLKNDQNDKVVVTRNEQQRNDDNIERNITLNGKTVLNDVTYLLPWTDEDNNEKLYHWNLDGGTTSWDLIDGWNTLGNVVVYELSDQGRINELSVPVIDGKITLDAKAATAYVVSKGAQATNLPRNFGQSDYVVDPGFNGYAHGEKLSENVWSGDITNSAISVTKADTGDQRLTFKNPEKDVTVSTQIRGLKAGTNYVAEVYVENNSDSKATLSVQTDGKTVSNYTERSILMNYVKSDQKNGSKMQRMMIPFKAEKDTATLSLSRAAGMGETYIDDIRIVEKTINNLQEDGSFHQDFESVVQGLYPFVLSSAQGINDPATHLSQLNAPYTQAGWNGRVIDDVIDGEWSVKHHDANTGIIYQTLPQTYRFEPGKVYTVEFDYQSGPDKAYAMVVGDGTKYTTPTDEKYLAQAHGSQETKHVSMNFVGSQSGQTWIGLYQNASKSGTGNMGQRDFTLDNLEIRENKDIVFADVTTTSLYKGEVSTIVGNRLDEIEWSSSDESVATVHPSAKEIRALKEGKTTITGTLPDKTTLQYVITVTDSVVQDVEREEYGSLTVDANTEEPTGEAAGSGIKEAAGDGNSSTYWHSNWSTGFVVSESNPAILTVGLEKPLNVNGFKFQQRGIGGSNGLVGQFSYRILAEDGKTVLASGEHIKVTDDQKKNGAWIIVPFEQKARSIETVGFIEISVEQGINNFAAIAEVQPIRIQRVADSATLSDVTLLEGMHQQLEVKYPENTVLKGIVWESSKPDVVSVSQSGEVTGLQKGTAVISIHNAAGLYAEATVTVEKNPLNLDALREQITKAKALDLSKYPDSEEKTQFIQALSRAEDVLNTAKEQADVTKATKDLADAQEALMKTVFQDTQAPTSPKNLKANIKETHVDLTWDASTDNVGVVGYKVYLGADLIGEVNTTAATINNLKAGTTYRVDVRAYDAAGNVSDAAQVSFTTKETASGGQPDNNPEQPDNKPSIDPEKPGDNTNNGAPTVKPMDKIDTSDKTNLPLYISLSVLACGTVIVAYRRKQAKKA